MSKATIVSLYPDVITEVKHGMFPTRFVIPAAERDDFSLLHIEDAFHYVIAVGIEDPIRYPVPAEEVANSIVNDFCSAFIGIDNDSKPGLFFLPGHASKTEISLMHKSELDAAKTRQNNWYKNLVAMADDTWARTRQHKSISDLQRTAAKQLALKRDWTSVVPEKDELCPACKVSVHPDAIICHNCKTIIDLEQYKKLQFSEA